MGYLDKHRINYLRKDIELLFIRFTRNRQGSITYLDVNIFPKIK